MRAGNASEADETPGAERSEGLRSQLGICLSSRKELPSPSAAKYSQFGCVGRDGLQAEPQHVGFTLLGCFRAREEVAQPSPGAALYRQAEILRKGTRSVTSCPFSLLRSGAEFLQGQCLWLVAGPRLRRGSLAAGERDGRAKSRQAWSGSCLGSCAVQLLAAQKVQRSLTLCFPLLPAYSLPAAVLIPFSAPCWDLFAGTCGGTF